MSKNVTDQFNSIILEWFDLSNKKKINFVMNILQENVIYSNCRVIVQSNRDRVQ